MLTISHGAAEAIKQIVEFSQTGGGGGLRISAEPVDDQNLLLDLSVTDDPQPGDSLVEGDGASVFLEHNAAIVLDDKVLDATVEGDTVSFQISEQFQDPSQNGHRDHIDPRRIS
ncbi:MAG: HesB/YadR/YfhF-family protein [Actinomycetota bacterium]